MSEYVGYAPLESAQYGFVSYGLGFTIQKGPKIYGRVRRGGKVFFRKYGREIKGGLSFDELLVLRVEQSRERLREMCGITAMMVGK